ncbi:FKBP-type peptidyl-prolyl cis-trans isomerase [Rickettsiella grylli]|uniref:Peptidyl-prolyl cis-trans isomerase n=1 Tax=Rickettsiella grylli TaxID=59196 RepID=A8PL14_9COXI|nr:FKBP-type peptidyl-prolyl cis-trans isomerase [Rickettsiella grylli]EDP46033.1 peptidyl-prolyl cis-trans isomerase Mip (PPIase) (Rotamase) (Macrophage infectivity potentiator) [Rickettsiella grylli]
MTRLPLLTVLAGILISPNLLAAQSTPPLTVNQQKSPINFPKIVSHSPLLKTAKGQISYSIGADLAVNFKEQGIQVDPIALEKGLADGMNGKFLLTQAQMADILKNFQQELMNKRHAEFKNLSLKNKQQGDAFLAANKIKPGVITLKSGIQYKIIQAGSGERPTDTSLVKVEYTGSDIHGTVFEKSKEPVTFPLNNVIPGWIEVLKIMKPGATYQVVIPPQFAYGEHGIDKAIGPNQTLVFTIHLIDVKKNT